MKAPNTPARLPPTWGSPLHTPLHGFVARLLASTGPQHWAALPLHGFVARLLAGPQLAHTHHSPTPHLAYHRPRLAPYQVEFMDHPARYVVVEAATKTGKTTACLVWLIEQALLSPAGSHCWWVAPTLAQATMALRRARLMTRHWPHTTASESAGWLALPNGARLWFRTAERPDALYGEDVRAAVVDEATRCRPQAWHALRSTLTATQGRVRIIGNVKGNRNWVRALAVRAQAEANTGTCAYFRITAWDALAAGLVTQQEIDDARDTLPQAVFRELYEALPSEAEGNPFGGAAALHACVLPPGQAPGPPRFFGVDLGKSHDYTVVAGLDAQGRLATLLRFRLPWVETLARVRQAIPQGAWALADSTGAGDAVVEQLQRHLPLLAPFVFTAHSKQQLMEQLAVGLQQRQVGLPLPLAQPVLAELEAFECQVGPTGRVRYGAPTGFHDDCVCALALAFRCLEANRYRASGFDYWMG